MWLTETGYPGIELDDPPEDIMLANDVTSFAESRQNAYVDEAITSAVEKQNAMNMLNVLIRYADSKRCVLNIKGMKTKPFLIHCAGLINSINGKILDIMIALHLYCGRLNSSYRNGRILILE